MPKRESKKPYTLPIDVAIGGKPSAKGEKVELFPDQIERIEQMAKRKAEEQAPFDGGTPAADKPAEKASAKTTDTQAAG